MYFNPSKTIAIMTEESEITDNVEDQAKTEEEFKEVPKKRKRRKEGEMETGEAKRPSFPPVNASTTLVAERSD